MEFADVFPQLPTGDWRNKRLGLERITELTHLLGNPQDELRFVHVAGTNGKGSVCAMLAAILTAAGYRTGMYTSPHLVRVNERMKVNGIDISDGDLVSLAEKVKPAADVMKDHPTEFEIITAMAFLYFKEQRCDVVVLEVGLGGRLDATNIIQPPDVAVICNIGLEHTEILGDTLEKIAVEKAGIIKPGCSAVLYEQGKAVEGVVAEKCRSCGVPLRITDGKRETLISADLTGQMLSYRERESLRLSLLGSYQYHNAAVALDTVDVLIQKGYTIPDASIAAGFEQVRWPGRFEVLRRHPLVIADGAHNPNGVEELVRCIRQYLPGKKLTFVMGVMADKDYRTMLRSVVPLADRFIVVTPQNYRALISTSLKKEIERICQKPVIDAGSVQSGLSSALRLCGEREAICIFGSLYQIGEVHQFLCAR